MVSVCIPAYQQPEFLEKALLCLCEQTFTDFEVIITDDSPDDAVLRLMDSFRERLPITYKKNTTALGTPANWNAALALATGEYVLVHHHDDWLRSPDALARLVHHLDISPKAAFVFASTQIEQIYSQEIIRINRPTETQLSTLAEHPEQLLVGNFIGVPSTVLFRRKYNLRFDTRLKWLVDIDFYEQLLRCEPHFCYEPLPLVGVGISSTQVTASVLNDATVQLPEYFYVVEKWRISLEKAPYFDFFGNLLARLNIRSDADIRAMGYAGSLPDCRQILFNRYYIYKWRTLYVKSIIQLKKRLGVRLRSQKT